MTTCECGCGAVVARRFKPGHDAKLKGRLLQAAKSSHWARRDRAVWALIELGWGHKIDPETARKVKARDTTGRPSVALRDLQSGLIDEAGILHSRHFCRRQHGAGTWTRDHHRGWSCPDCIHTVEAIEMVKLNAWWAIADRD